MKLQYVFMAIFWLFGSLFLVGCGGNTSVFFCSGGEEFCSGVAKRALQPDPDPDPEDDAAVAPTASRIALEVARKTPGVVKSGLESNGMEATLRERPDTVGLWLIASSLGLLVDGSDDLAATRFYDHNRYWLGSAQMSDEDVGVLVAGLKALAVASAERDPAVAELAAAKASQLATGGEGQLDSGAAPVDQKAVLIDLGSAELAGECCSDLVLAASAMQMCEVLAARGDDLPGMPPICAAARFAAARTR